MVDNAFGKRNKYKDMLMEIILMCRSFSMCITIQKESDYDQEMHI